MDPIAHTLAGATLAQTRLKKYTPLAAAALIIGANLPDIDAIFIFVGADASLFYRRGWTHGVLALIILPLLLAGGVFAFDRFFRRRRQPQLPAAHFGALVGLSYIGVLSHPALDWLNTYGIRLLMPFDGKWFYGDTLFIVDPWLWLLMAAAAVLAYSQQWLSKAMWLFLGAATSLLVIINDSLPAPAKLVWAVGILNILLFRALKKDSRRIGTVALFCLVAFCLYLAAMFAGNRRARDFVLEQIDEPGIHVNDLMVGPVPADPFQRYVVVKTSLAYHGFNVSLFGELNVEQAFQPVPLPAMTPEVTAALKRPEIRGFANWVRFPTFTTEKVKEGTKVMIRDLRYMMPGDPPGRGIGYAEVVVPEAEVNRP